VSPATLQLYYYSLTSRVMFISFQDYCQQHHSRHKLNYISLGSSGEVIYCCLLFPSSPHLSVITLRKTCAPVCRYGDAEGSLQLRRSCRACAWQSVLAALARWPCPYARLLPHGPSAWHGVSGCLSARGRGFQC